MELRKGGLSASLCTATLSDKGFDKLLETIN